MFSRNQLADPELDGWTFMRAVREPASERGKGTPAIAVSVHNEPADRMKSLSAGSRCTWRSPSRPADLAGRIAQLVKSVPGP